jgi:amino acid adenylation domain-containing protein
MTLELIHQLFEDQVNRTPDNIAVVMDENTITYRELNKRANRIAHYLIKKEILADQMIGISMRRSIEMITALLGILKAGGAYLPLDPNYPMALLNYIIKDANPSIILGDKAQYSLIATDERFLDFPNLETELLYQPDSNPEEQFSDGNLAYCIYTSGSSGMPKGVLVEHHSVVNFLHSAVMYYQITPADRVLQFASLNFDTSVEEIFPPLISGAALVLRKDDMTDSVQGFLAESDKLKISVLDLPAAFWHELVIYLDETKYKISSFLRLIIIGGERVSPDLLNTWHHLDHGSVLLKNTYGLTECTCVSTCCELVPVERSKFKGHEVTIGNAIENVILYILDANRNPVPEGSPGELYIGGDNLARGYQNLPDLTKERFIKDPVIGGNTRMYKTGDMVLRRTDGSLEYLGRNDDQIKIRGFRIEPGEIESIIFTLKKVKQVIVIKKTDPSGNDHLIAYIVTQSGKTIVKDELWKRLTEKLPAHMIPAFFVFLEELPLSPNNKIDKKSIPEPDWNDLARTASSAPTTETEAMLLDIWEDALGRKGFGVDDDFFEIGGNSILAARVATAVERNTCYPIPMAVLIETPTIRGLAKLVATKGWEPDWQTVVPMRDKGSKPPLFLVHAMWGDILSYRRLVNRIKDNDQPVYGIRARGFDGKAAPFTDLKAMAAYYVAEMKTVQPAGPYYLGGYSFGGTVAFEIAQQLVSKGEQVALLAMLDTVILESLPPDLIPSHLEVLGNEISKYLLAYRKWFGISFEKKIAFLKEATTIIKDWLSAKLLGKRFISPGEIEGKERKTAMPESYRIVHEANSAALKSYIARPYPGKITLFNAHERQWSDLINPVPFWKKMALGGVESYTCSGKHYSLLDEPHVSDLAEKLESVLREKQSQNIKQELWV